MSLSNNIYKLRSDYKLSQDEFAAKLDVTRQAVQKWESGTANPDLGKIMKIAKLFNVSVDALLFNSTKRVVEELPYEKTIIPDFESFPLWEDYARQLNIEYRQAVEEGLDISEYKDLFDAVLKMPKGLNQTKMADILFDIVYNSKTAEEYKYDEPSDLEEIKLKRKGYTFPREMPGEEELKDKILGAWLGRICGCLLGKPIEGIKTDELIPLLKESGNFPMKRYILSSDITDEMCEKYPFRLKDRCWADTIKYAPFDDDTNYTVLYQLIVERYGRDFTPNDVKNAWLDCQPKYAYCTAERVAYCNFVKGYMPPKSAIYKNPYREWIGAQIRGDYFGYINPGNPEKAAEMAWRDGSVSHVKNGIYGEMFVAAMIAAAAVTDDICDIVMAGLAQIPAASRLYESVYELLGNYKKGVTQKQCYAQIHKKYDERDGHDWCHTISNALIVTAALLYGCGDYAKSICMAVEAGFDTDCNGATVGSILGMRNGTSGIGEEWTKPLNNKLETTIFGVGTIDIMEAAKKTMKHIEKDTIV